MWTICSGLFLLLSEHKNWSFTRDRWLMALLDDGSIHSVWWSIFNSMEKWLNNLLPHCSHFTQFSSERVPINIDQNCTKNPPTLRSWAESIKWYLNWRVVTPKVSANQILLLQWCVSPLGCCYTGLGIDQNPSSPRHPHCHPRTDHRCCNCDTNFALFPVLGSY